MSLPTRTQMIWQIVSNANLPHSKWHFPPNYKRKTSPNQTFRMGYKFLHLGHSDDRKNMDEIVVERVLIDERGGKHPERVTTTINIPWDYVDTIFRGKNVIFVRPK